MTAGSVQSTDSATAAGHQLVTPGPALRPLVRVIDVLLPFGVIGATLFVAGLGCGLLVAGIVALTAALMRVRSFDGPLRALAAAFVAEGVCVAAVSFVTAAVWPHGDFTLTAAVTLGTPLVIGLVTWAISLRTATRISPHRGGQIRFIVAVAGLFLAGALWLEGSGPYVAVTWSLSNDSANHLQIAESIVHHNGITLHQITSYPPIAELLVALVSGLPGRGGLAPGGVVIRDAQALAAVQMVAMCGIGLMFAACVWEFLVGGRCVRHIVVTYVLLGVSAAAVLTEAVSGVALTGGFLSALVGLLFSVAALALTVAIARSPEPVLIAFTFAGAVAALLTWVVLGTALVAVVIAAIVSYWAHGRPRLRSARSRRAALVVSGICALGVVGMLSGVAAYHTSFIATLRLPGAIAPIGTWPLVALVVVSGIGALMASGSTRWMFLVPVVVGVATFVVLVVLNAVTGAAGLSTYYEMKFIWLQLAALAWVPIAFIGYALNMVSGTPMYRRYLAVLGLLISGAVMWTSMSQTMPGSSARLITWVRQGGDFKNQAAMKQLLALSSGPGPVVVWGNGPDVNSPLMNFVSSQVFTAASMDPNSNATDSGFAFPVSRQAYYFNYWAHRIYPPNFWGKNTGVLCHLLTHETDVVVVASAPGVASRVATVCPTLAHRVARYVRLARSHT